MKDSEILKAYNEWRRNEDDDRTFNSLGFNVKQIGEAIDRAVLALEVYEDKARCKFWTNTKFTGIYPIGVAAVVRAENANAAAVILNDELLTAGLDADAKADEMVCISGMANNSASYCVMAITRNKLQVMK